MTNVFNAHIFKRRRRGEREEVTLKMYNLDGSPLNLPGGGGSVPVPVSDEPTLLYETFDGTLGNYVADASQGALTSLDGLSVANGMLHSVDANDHSFHASNLLYDDGAQIIKIWPTSATLVGIIKYISDQRWILLQYMPGSSQLGMYYTTEDGMNQILASNFGAPSYQNSPIYLMMVTSGQNVYASSSFVDPRSGARPFSFADARIPDNSAARLCVPGSPGIRFTGFASGYANPGVESRLDEWICKKYR